MGPAAGSAGRNGPGARACPGSPGQPGLAAAARRGGGGHRRGRQRPGPAGGAASRPAAIAHAAGLWRAERWLHLDIEPPLNHLAAARPVLAETVGYYYGLAHFIITPLVLAWLWLRRPAAFGPLRSTLVLATTAANLVFWTWPVAPPRFAVPGMTDVLARYRILGAGDPHGPDSLVNLYAAMPSLHVAWAAWCAAALVTATCTRWRQLAWLYPAATTLVVLATANHFLADAAAGLAITALGLLAARAATRPGAVRPGPGGAVPAAASPAMGPGAAGAVTAALLTRRHPAQAARPVTPLRPQASPPTRNSRPAHGRRHPPRRPRTRSYLPPGPEKVTATSARPGESAVPAAQARKARRRRGIQAGDPKPGRHPASERPVTARRPTKNPADQPKRGRCGP
jgi:hypothetical protein